ncbi:LPXTG cell wall anchor domain-containing protein [Streptococcus salivarius]|uniref:LPXTG cell wall anchor domain-containing protein n=1 Tax=Streptococcus salivarius TaxID=1304 RepID=UPI002C0256AD|nr:LPXTG cell wall anchor domain-containing protein [Streptococcus salivarius]MEB3645880.1 LPXTG cell wall anchor domain-containing protein [Streptococcus salivarius]
MSINKLSKYGIVLVAAVTLATAVQTQFGQSSTKVYAEEIANDPSLNRMLYINVSSPDDPTLGWLTGEVVTPKGYIVESAGEVEGFPYFTITGSNGKNYSVGDVITTEEPGLFGHANMEDDALYYRYYRTNPNSVSEAPAVSTTPATSEAPAVSTTPATSETPAVSTTPATSEAPAASTAPATSETPAVNTTPTTSEAPAVSTTPATGLVPSKNIHSMNSVTSPFTQTRNAGIKSEADGKLTSHDLPKTGDTNSKVGMLGMVLVGLGLTSFVYKGRHRRS